jgi:hypothetical protein
LCDVIESLKKDSSKWIKTKGRTYRNFHWQSGYGAFSVSQSNVAQVVKYIEQQKEHHRRRTFQEEFRAFRAMRRSSLIECAIAVRML